MTAARLDAVAKGLPRRLSVIKGQPNYDAAAGRLSDRIDVLLDGDVLFEVGGYDVDAGTVIRNRRYRDESLVLDDQGCPVLETLHGIVEVRWARREGGAA